MFKFKVTVKGDRAAQQALNARLVSAASLAADTVAERVKDLVREKIPEGGWYDIYREAITYFVTPWGLKWAVSGLWPSKFSTFPADTTLLTFTGTGDVADAIVQYNPWPIDQVPAVTGGYRLNVVARPAAPADVDERRRSIASVIENVKAALTRAGATVKPGEFPEINGIVYADIAFMAKALEHGLAGLKRVPHWAAVFRMATTSKESMGSWIEKNRHRIQQILDGEATFEAKAPPMPPGLEQSLSGR